MNTGGFVTGINYLGAQLNYYFISDRPGGPWRGILVRDNANRGLAVGDSVHLSATVEEANGQTRLRNVTAGDRYPDSVAIPPASILCSELGESVEGVLVELHNIVVASKTDQEFVGTDGTGNVTVGSGWSHVMPAVGDTLLSLRGIVTSAGSAFTLNPRSDADVTFISDRPPTIANVRNFPAAPLNSQPDTVMALITDETTVTDARIYYRFATSGDFIPVSMFDDGTNGDPQAGDNDWAGIIPAGPARTTCHFYLWAQDDSGKTITYPLNAPLTTLSFQVSPSMRDVYDHYENYQDSTVTLVGVVNFIQDVTTTSGSRRISAFMQDESGRGMNLSNSGAAGTYPNIARGNRIAIRGKLTTYAGAIQMGSFANADVTVLATDVLLPAPIVLATGDRRQQRSIIRTSIPGAYGSGTWCKVTGTIYRVDENVGGGTNIAIDDGTGSTTIRIWDSMNIDSVMLDSVWYPMRELAGKYISIYGPSSSYNGDFQMLGGGSVEDFEAPQLDADSVLRNFALDVPNRPFAPDLGQKLHISYTAPAMGQVRLRVFDLRGRLVYTLVDKQAGGPNVIDWDGRNDLNEFLPLGTYILHLESVESGNSHTKIKPVVIGTKL